MASATVDSSVCNCQNHLHTESLPLIYLHHLSQSELLSLSFCSSSSSLSINRLQTDTADVSTPKIDRTVFNESAGSRKQTFSRLRLAPRTNNTNASSSGSTPVAPYQITERQYLDEENTQIISLLKSLFGSDSQSIENENHDNLVSVPIIYNDYMCLSLVKDVEFQNVPISIADSSRELKGLEANYSISTPMAESNSNKRKRGRPRKNESIGSDKNKLVEEEKVEKKTVVAFDNVGVENQKKDGMMIVNNNGVMVDLAALGNMEDPYGEELRRRTEGMGTKAELLGFLEGFDGEWGSVRKKRRIVDASFFGDALPAGWKLLVCVKKQGDRGWLDCTRYISPNGQQFMSCKEVSSYLLSFSGHHDANQSNTVDGRIQLTENVSSSISADHTLRVGKQENDFVCYKTLPISCKFIETGGCLGEGQMGKKYKCHKCTMSFDEQDDLLQHLLSSHQRTPKRLKCGQSTNEVIVKNGKYECQFCHKLFEERHRFNGHLGNHIKDYIKRRDASSGIITQKSDQHAALVKSPGPVKIQTSIGIDSGSGAITSSNKANHEITSAVTYCEMKENTYVENYYGEQDRVFNISNDKLGKTNEATDVAAAENSVSSELALLNNKGYSSHRSSDGTDAFECPANGIDDFGSGGRHLAYIVCNSSKQISPSLIDKFSLESGFKSGSWSPTAKENTSNDDIFEDRHCSSTIDTLVIDDRNTVGTSELRTGFHNCSVAMAENSAAVVKEQRESEGWSVADDVTGLSTSIVVETMQEKGSTGNLSCIESDRNIVCTGILNKGKFDYVDRSGNNELRIGNDTVPVEDSVARNEQGISQGCCSVISFSNGDMHVENNMTVNPSCTLKKPCQVKVSEGGLHTTSGNKPSFGPDSNLVKDSNGPINVSKHDKVQCSVNSEIDLVVQSVTNIEQDRSSNIFSFFPSTNGLASASKEKGICNNTKGKLRLVRNFGHTPYLNEQTRDDENGTNVASCIIVEHQDKEAKTSCNGELHIALGDSCTEQDTDVVTSSVQEGCVLFPGNQHKFTPKDNATCPYSDSVDKLKQKLGSVESSLCLSCREQVQSLEKNLHVAFTGSVQESRLGNLDNPRNVESRINFSRPSRTKENVISDFLQRPSAGNNLPTGFADISSQPEQTSGCLQHDAVSHKGESEFFGEKLGGVSGFGGPKSENMEHNFLTSQASSHSDDSRFGSNEAAIAQGFDSSIWLKKEDLPCMPNNVSRQHVPTVCVWCGSELCHEAPETEGQTNAMGFICAHCSAKLSRQFNVQ